MPAPPIAAPEAALLYDLLSLEAPARRRWRICAASGAAAARHRPGGRTFAARLEALAARGIDTAALPFEASHGRTTLEYYDGFVFSFHAADRACRRWPRAGAMTR
jgi:ATP phosphoribosyltransferase regulatory subunit